MLFILHVFSSWICCTLKFGVVFVLKIKVNQSGITWGNENKLLHVRIQEFNPYACIKLNDLPYRYLHILLPFYKEESA